MSFLPPIREKEDLVRLVDEIGFLPYFRNDVPGFSIEENCPALWGTPDKPDCPWDWKGPVIRETGCAYGRFFHGRAGYVSRALFPDFANVRRDGYDYDARVEDGLARGRDRRIMEVLSARSPLPSRELKALCCFGEDSRRAYDASLGFLQMQTYVTTADFVYATDRLGRPYGWGLAVVATPEQHFGADFTARVYAREPAESRERLRVYLRKLLPQATAAQLERLLG
ncbi:MAG: hypothetical protein K6G17_01900 [Oscillospiraceae bacterium]|nr:hypothetical protein [Oscillospiraceae bacterium]